MASKIEWMEAFKTTFTHLVDGVTAVFSVQETAQDPVIFFRLLSVFLPQPICKN